MLLKEEKNWNKKITFVLEPYVCIPEKSGPI